MAACDEKYNEGDQISIGATCLVLTAIKQKEKNTQSLHSFIVWRETNDKSCIILRQRRWTSNKQNAFVQIEYKTVSLQKPSSGPKKALQIENKENLSCSTPTFIPSASRKMHVSAITNHWCHRSTGWASKRRSLLAWGESSRVFFAREQIGQLVAGNLQRFETIPIIHQPDAQQTFGAWSTRALIMCFWNCMRMRRMHTTLNVSWAEVNCALHYQTT